ncbi:MAG: hypothetical protein ACREBO_01685 [Novosphingobium sp.]
MLWVEGRLGPVERACMRSVLAQGHRLILWHYAPLEGVPEGVELRDGAAIVPRERLFRHVPTGSYSLFSNLFRYELLRQGHGLWLDGDVYLLKPIASGDGHVFGFAQPGTVASAILGMPAGSPVLTDLIGYFDARRVPPWLPIRWRLRYAWQKVLRGTYRIETMPWGNLGPVALTNAIARHGLQDRIRNQAVFSPWTWREAHWIFDPDMHLEDRATQQTLAVHLFNEIIRSAKDSRPAAGSFLERLHQEGG